MIFGLIVAAACAQADPAVVLTAADATTVPGKLIGLSEGTVKLRLADGSERDWAWDQVYKIVQPGRVSEGSPAPPYPPRGPALLLFPDGDRLACAVESADEKEFSVRSNLLDEVKVPLGAPRAVLLAVPSADVEGDVLGTIESLAAGAPGTESVRLANGDVQKVGFLGIDGGSGQISARVGAAKVTLERGGVVAIAMNPALIRYPKPTGPYVEATLADGSRLGLVGANLKEGELIGTTRYGAAFRVAFGDVAAIHVRTPAMVELLTRKIVINEALPYGLDKRWLRYRVDAAAGGGPLTLGGERYDRGLGMDSRRVVQFALEPGDKRFQATVGVDDRAGPSAGVVFRVLLDRTEAFRSKPMAAGDPPAPIDLDLGAAKRLTLVVETGPRGEVRDWADWVEPRIATTPDTKAAKEDQGG